MLERAFLFFEFKQNLSCSLSGNLDLLTHFDLQIEAQKVISNGFLN